MTTPIQKAEIDRTALGLKINMVERKVASHTTSPLSIGTAAMLLKKIDTLTTQLNEVHLRIAHLAPADMDPHEAIFISWSERLENAAIAVTDIKALVTPTPVVQSPTHHTSSKLPVIPLPTFDGKYEEWPAFEDLFKAAIDKKNIQPCEKLQYLKSCLKGDAATIVRAFTTTDANYAEAWKLVAERYQNTREIVFSLIEKLLNQQHVKPDSVASLQSLVNSTTECIQSLKVMGRPTDAWSDLLIVFIMKKLDPDTRSEWAKTFQGTDVPTFVEHLEFIEKHIRTLYARGSVNRTMKPSTSRQANSHHITTEPSTSSSSSVCKVCNTSNHHLYQCQVFIDKKPEERQAIVKRSRACFNCLRGGHSINNCTSTSTCKKCNKKHHTLIHRVTTPGEQPKKPIESSEKNSNSNPAANTANPPPAGPSQNVRANTSSFESNSTTQVLLKTAVVDVIDSAGIKQPCRILLDDGSEASFITEACARGLGLRRYGTDVSITGISAAKHAHVRWKVNARVHSQIHDAFVDIEALILPRVTGTLPRVPISSANWNHIIDLRLADPHFAEPGDVDMLLGADVVASIMREGRRQGPSHSPIAQNSIFGWVLSGRVSSIDQTIIRANFASCCNLEDIVKRFWEIEEPPTQQQQNTPEERDCEAHFSNTHSRQPDGRYSVRLPFKPEIKNVGDTRQQALQRFHQLERKFRRYPHHHQEYKKFMQEYQDMGHMELVQDTQSTTHPIIYLPHHFVTKEDSTTTKLRVVFDGSAKSTSGLSLNDCLMVGPTIQEDLFSLLLRFRFHPIAIKGDIAKMYRQFRVHKPDADCQRILWRDNPNAEIQEFRLLTITYGTASAPFQATRCLKQLAEDERTTFPAAAKILEKDLYVDDLLSGESTTTKTIGLVNDLIEICKLGNMSIRKWCSNDPMVMNSIPENLRETSSSLGFDTDEIVKALGVQWNPTTDCFHFKVNQEGTSETITKRKLLSDMARVFDPLGWLAPATIVAKIILQQLWRKQIDWDEEVPVELHEVWMSYQEQLQQISTLRIPRCAIQLGATTFELHGFCDSSERAYASAIYLKSISSSAISVHLLSAKSKVAPLKQVSLPRLELCGAHLLSEHLHYVKQSINFPCDVYTWTDSSIVLRWISSSSRRWKTYVANRVSQIQALFPAEHWHHVRSEDNPADLPTRGVSPSDLASSTLWWHGPGWLMNSCYPILPSTADMQIVIAEQRTVPVISLHTTCSPVWTTILSKFSSWKKISRIVSYWLRFITFIKTKNCSTDPLTPCEIIKSQHQLISYIQGIEFSEDVVHLKTNGAVSQSSKLKKLTPFIDQSGLIRVEGRLQQSHLTYEEKHPIILPHNHLITTLIINDCHLSNMHSGLTLTMSTLRRKYWILRERDTVRLHLRKCIICRRRRAKTAVQLMGSLPKSRVIPSRPFEHCGVDFAGPFQVKMQKARGGKLHKVYFSIFICFTTKAIHLEAVTDLTMEAFVACYRRFVSRRGIVNHLHSDCGTNFVGAAKEFRHLLNQQKNQIQEQLADVGTTWHFNPPSAPHQGGLWDAGVKSVKYHFHRVVGNTTLTFEQFMTLLCNIEACLNSRPLCSLSSDPFDLDALTPGHFLVGRPLTSVPDPDLTHLPTNRLSYWQHVQQIGQHFWKRWCNEYLTSLQQRHVWYKKTDNLAVGDLVVVKDDMLPPTKWKLGRIVQVFPGQDKLVRCVRLRVSTGEITRPITKLSPLLCSNEA